MVGGQNRIVSAESARRVTAAFEAVPRATFLPPEVRGEGDHDRPLPIGHGQTNSQPWTVRRMLELLDVEPGMRVLDVGAGSGWTTALLAHLTGPRGSVVGVEVVPALVGFGAANVAATGWAWARVVAAEPGRLGLAAEAPYDRILVSAEASRVPRELIAQLAPRGRMVTPVRDRMSVVDVTATGSVDIWEDSGRYRFVPLIEPPA